MINFKLITIRDRRLVNFYTDYDIIWSRKDHKMLCTHDINADNKNSKRNPLIKVITGIRRSGKSSIPELLNEELVERMEKLR